MSFFDELPQKAKGAAGTVKEKARDAVDSAKITASILSEKRQLSRNYLAVGQWYVCEHTGEVPDAIADVVAAIRVSQERIAELQAKREAAETAETLTDPEGTACPVCGKISNTKFCPHCGAPMGN